MHITSNKPCYMYKGKIKFIRTKNILYISNGLSFEHGIVVKIIELEQK